MNLQYTSTANSLQLTVNGTTVSGSGLLNFESDDGGTPQMWCVGPFDKVQSGWTTYIAVDLVPSARESQLAWVIQDQDWSTIADMSGVEQDAFGLLLNEAVLESPGHAMDLATGDTVIQGAPDPMLLASTWLDRSAGKTSHSASITVLRDDAGQDQASWHQIPLGDTVSMLVLGLAIMGGMIATNI